MSMIRPIAWLAALAVILGMAEGARAQSVVTSAGSDAFWRFQPFYDPGYFEPDFQFFAPAEVNDFGGEEKPNVGLYFSFDRTYVNVSRPGDFWSFGSQSQGDFTWGNRIEVGYMKGDPDGWQAVVWHVNGPNEKFENAASQVLVENTPGDFSDVFVLGQAFDSLNILKMSSFELNKVWRRPQFHNGINFEPFLGYRYMNVRDFWQRQINTEVAVNVPPLTEFFLKDSAFALFENNMHGGQLGFRMFRQRGHWMLSTELKFFVLANFQTLKNQFSRSLLPNPGEQPGNVIVDIIGPGLDVERTVTHSHASQFAWGGELKGEASYELTRDINLRVGFVFLDIGQGIGRGNLLRFNNQAVQMSGVTFGFTYNR